MARLNYVEFPAAAFGATREFYEKAFGFSLTAFGPSYAATMTGGMDMGLQGDAGEATRAPLPVFQVDDLEAAMAAATAAGGKIAKPIFSFPGGRRFHVTDPSGNEVAVMAPD